MAAVHFTTMSANLTQRTRHKESQFFFNNCPCTKDIEWPWFEDFITFLYVFMSVVKVFVR